VDWSIPWQHWNLVPSRTVLQTMFVMDGLSWMVSLVWCMRRDVVDAIVRRHSNLRAASLVTAGLAGGRVVDTDDDAATQMVQGRDYGSAVDVWFMPGL